jgi:DNA transformation protein
MPSSKDQDFLEFVLDQLAGLKGVTSRRMFGGIGLYRADTFFAIIDEGRLYFVTDEKTRAAYIDLGMKPFQYAPDKFIHTYYEVPVDVLEDDGALCEWAHAAVDAQKARARRSPSRSRTKSRARTSSPRKVKAPTQKVRTPARKRP